MIILKKKNNNFWNIAEVWEDETLIVTINMFYEVTEDWILIFETIGGSGTGWKKGQLKQKINIRDKEFKTIEI